MELASSATNTTVTSLFVALFVVTFHYQRYSFRGSVLIALVVIAFLMSSMNRDRSCYVFIPTGYVIYGLLFGFILIKKLIYCKKMDKDYVQLNLRENNEEFLINLSPDDALKVQNGKL